MGFQFPLSTQRAVQQKRGGRRKRLYKNIPESKQKCPTPARPSVPGSFPAECDHSGSSSGSAVTTISHPKFGPSSSVTDASRAFWALLCTLLYANPQSRKLAGRIWTRFHDDPVLAILCFLCIVLMQRCVLHIPNQISLWSDSSVIFEDVFGIEIRVPYQQCEQFEYFHGFLEYYFRQRPGLKRVVHRRYRLLLGDSRGRMIERSVWTKVVRPRTRLTMAMLLLSAQSQCGKCFGELESRDQYQTRIW
jgi:hypothetical protein